ncbi:TraI/MobA(P) family conjugative relaxase [Thiomonas intermedia]|uniref:TraI/MobA(P) family conjugative relaxase n=1 Tax=Thiomonas intermedia TaxID=926 RepID=UPI0009A51A89|nr:TraI/MobA(P) family conjugative relaxase [Thiomonas intermedia]
MLAKVITLKHSATGNGFAPVMRYVMRADPRSTLPAGEMLEAGHINIPDEALYWELHENRLAYAEDLAGVCDSTTGACRAKGRFHGNPVYHVAINWKEGECPTAKQAERACRHVMQALGYSDHQAAWAIHRDTDNDHVHLVINRVHPESLLAISPPFKKDYLILDRCMRELEIEFGQERANGPFITLDSPSGPKVVRMSRAERRERGLVKEGDQPRLTRGASASEHRQGAESFQTWVAGSPAHDLRECLSCAAPTWGDVHQTLARHGVTMQAKGSGLVVTTRLPDGRVLAGKASQLGRWASKGELEKRLGPFVPLGAVPDLRPVYSLHIEAVRREVQPPQPSRKQAEGRAGAPVSPNPGSTDDQRAWRRQQRAEARVALAERFKTEQDSLRRDRPRQRADLRERQRRERAFLRAEQRKARALAYAVARREGQSISVALSLWAWSSAREREALQKRQAEERKALSAKLPRSEVWRKWLERQAEQGDMAAQAALRGIRYREQGASRHQRDGIEGEDIEPLRKLVLAELDAQIDQRRQRVRYRDARGREVFTDTGPRIEVHDKGADSLEAALRIAAQKYGGQVEITGSAEFREMAARQAIRLGIRVVDADLAAVVTDEQARMGAVRAGLSTETVEESGRMSGKSLKPQAPIGMPAGRADQGGRKHPYPDIDQALDAWEFAPNPAQRSRAARLWIRAVEDGNRAGESIAKINEHTRQRLGDSYDALMRQVSREQERQR